MLGMNTYPMKGVAGRHACANDCKKEHKQIEFGNKKCWIASVEEGVHPGFEPGCS